MTKPKSLKRRIADVLLLFIDRAERLGGERFYNLRLEDAARRHRRGRDIMEIEAGNRSIKFRSPSGKALWRAETLLTKEPMTIAWIDGFAEGDIFWDIGANVGIYSLYAASEGIRTLAFEPASFNHALLCDNIRLNEQEDRLAAYDIAFWHRSQLGRLDLEDDEPGAAFASLTGGGTLVESVLVYTIDDFVDQFTPPFPTHIKIDVDGVEEQILQGASLTLAEARLKSLLVEVEELDPERPKRVDSVLSHYGFKLEEVQVSPLTPTSPSRNRRYSR